MLASFGRDVLMCHWNYHEDYPAQKAALLLDAGFQVLACPATVCWQTRLAVNTANLTNLRNTAARSLPQTGRGLVGVLNTVWCPWRFLPGELDFGLAFGGHLLTAPAEDPAFAEHFAAAFYGLTRGSRALGNALLGLTACTPPRPLFARVLEGPTSSTPFNREDQRVCALLADQADGVVRALRAGRAQIRRNLPRYDDVLLTAEVVLAFNRFGASGRKPGGAAAFRALLRRGLQAWSRDRQPRDPKRFGDPRHHGDDSLLACLRYLALRHR
jgi:hypothetical protein